MTINPDTTFHRSHALRAGAIIAIARTLGVLWANMRRLPAAFGHALAGLAILVGGAVAMAHVDPYTSARRQPGRTRR